MAPIAAITPYSFVSQTTPTTFDITIPDEITDYTPGQTNAIMVAGLPMSTKDSPYDFSFQQIAGQFKFRVENVPVGTKAFEFTTDNNITGTWSALDSRTSAIDVQATGKKTVKLVLKEPVTMQNQTMDFYVAAPMGTYTEYTVRLLGNSNSAPLYEEHKSDLSLSFTSSNLTAYLNISLSATSSTTGMLPQHPRLYLTESDIPRIAANMETAQGKSIMGTLQWQTTPMSEAQKAQLGNRQYYYNRGVSAKVQLQALDYLLHKDAEQARAAITATLDTLSRATFPSGELVGAGMLLSTGALVYDWCYDQITSDEKTQFVEAFKRVASNADLWPFNLKEPICGHGSEYVYLRDMLAVSIAIYDEYPCMFEQLYSGLTTSYVPPRNFFYDAGNFHQGTNYINIRFVNDLLSQAAFMKMGMSLYNNTQQDVLYDFIYRKRPDGVFMPAGDVNPGAGTSISMVAHFASSMYKDPYLAYEVTDIGHVFPHLAIHALVLGDFSVQKKAPTDLPLTRFSPKPFGWMIARTGWGSNSAIVEMKVNENIVGNHQHLDGGAFQIYYNGPLAIDAGAYEGTSGGYDSEHDKNFFKRTIAHNSLLIYNPSEIYTAANYGGASSRSLIVANDGGQRTPGLSWNSCNSYSDLLSDAFTYGKTLAHAFGPSEQTPEYSYLKGDLTQAYTSAKTSEVLRSFVFFNTSDANIPGVLVIRDRIIAKKVKKSLIFTVNPDKYWLLHSVQEPTVSGKTFDIVRNEQGYSGKLHCDVLTDATIEKVGGSGKEFYVFGKNYPQGATSSVPDTKNEKGSWRIQLKGNNKNLTDDFLNVIQITSSGNNSYYTVKKITATNVLGTQVGNWAAIFSANSHELTKSITFNVDATNPVKVFVSDLAAGTWKVTNGTTSTTYTVTTEKHSLYFTATSAKCTITKM